MGVPERIEVPGWARGGAASEELSGSIVPAALQKAKAH